MHWCFRAAEHHPFQHLGDPGDLGRSRDHQRRLLQKGEEVTYFPDTYKVSLVVDGEQGAGYARNMLDAIIQSYCTYYTEKYVEQKLSLNPSSGLLDNGYDYYECIRILENDTNEMQDYLLSKREHYPNFRSSHTGYTYADLCDIYSDFKKYTIPALYAYVLNGPQVRDARCCRNIWPTPSKLQSRTNRSLRSSGTVCGA